MSAMDPKDMFAKFTRRTRHVLQFAKKEAQDLNHNYVGTEHLLLGLLREGEGVGAKVLERLGVQLETARQNVLYIIGRGDRVVRGDIGLTPRSKKVLELSVDEARRLGHPFVGTEHLLLGMLREGEGIAAGVLASLGVNLEDARKEVIQTLVGEALLQEEMTAEGNAEVSSDAKANVITCRIDDRDLDALDALVEAGIRSTRSGAAAWLIHSGIEAQHDLLNRVHATVAQIRQLRAEAQSLVQDIKAQNSEKGKEGKEDKEGDEPGEPL